MSEPRWFEREIPLVVEDAEGEWCVGTATMRVLEGGDYWLLDPKDLDGEDLKISGVVIPQVDVPGAYTSREECRAIYFSAPWGFKVHVFGDTLVTAKAASASGRTRDRMIEIGSIQV